MPADTPSPLTAMPAQRVKRVWVPPAGGHAYARAHAPHVPVPGGPNHHLRRVRERNSNSRILAYLETHAGSLL